MNVAENRYRLVPFSIFPYFLSFRDSEIVRKSYEAHACTFACGRDWDIP